jgi:hypothetical protein
MTGFEKATLRWGKIAVLLSGLAAVFVCAQWYEMHVGGQDTHALAVAAGQQAAAANTQSQQAIAQTGKMSESLSKTDDLIRATNVLAGEAKRSANIARTTMITGTRAYLALARVKLYCQICDPKFTPTPGLATPERNRDASVNLSFINSGHSPARDIDESAISYVAPIDKSFKFPEQPDMLEQPKHMMVQGSTDFPLEITRTLDAMNVVMARPNQIPCGNSTLSPPCKGFLYFYGHISYTDVFKSRHTLLYCVQYHPETYSSPEGWSACPYHNEEYDGDYKPN